MRGENSGSEKPCLAGSGHELDRGADPGWARALSGLTAELRSRGLDVGIDGRTGVVEATVEGSSRRTQRAVLRPHRGRLWWWLRWEEEAAGAGCAMRHSPLTPAARTGDAARRIAGVMGPVRTRIG
ncbi:hypothetical protein [Nocardiopsis potens]|uniref:hypothetical protein n=1 Tax=Nocardiopsis potens TaxID=1246458 RepID=UPI00034D85E4|nr:hypothetical protein [Nocardiopsis potens]